MNIITKFNYIKNKFIILLILIFFFIVKENVLEYFAREKLFLIVKKRFRISSFKDLFNTDITKGTVLIFEPNKYHHECLPGYSKYFIELGYNVDLLLHYSGIDSLSLYDNMERVRLFTFIDLGKINLFAKRLSKIIQNYSFVLVQTTDPNKLDLYRKLDFLNMNNSIFVFHSLNNIDINYLDYYKENRIWTIGNFSKGLQINPHYFGNINVKDKSDKVVFFMTSSYLRNYKELIESSVRLKKENYNFEIIITGRSNDINSNKIPKILKNIFVFKHQSSYFEMYKLVESSDYIIIPLDPNSEYDKEYKEIKATGSIQLVLGFLKPAIINQNFSDFYNLNNNNSLIYNNTNFYHIMKKSIILNKKDYIFILFKMSEIKNYSCNWWIRLYRKSYNC